MKLLSSLRFCTLTVLRNGDWMFYLVGESGSYVCGHHVAVSYKSSTLFVTASQEKSLDGHSLLFL